MVYSARRCWLSLPMLDRQRSLTPALLPICISLCPSNRLEQDKLVLLKTSFQPLTCITDDQQCRRGEFIASGLSQLLASLSVAPCSQHQRNSPNKSQRDLQYRRLSALPPILNVRQIREIVLGLRYFTMPKT